ncbi:unnamed protein product [Protopolystoma xenopodis]|uniref:Uncharacterized protein n=1 Tax=Protopolystoma xenopodis TaxID=117903 RepID=A0A3S5B248_9PLAT|nr:unnamed protein product [Protopolystoma xenopodis]
MSKNYSRNRIVRRCSASVQRVSLARCWKSRASLHVGSRKSSLVQPRAICRLEFPASGQDQLLSQGRLAEEVESRSGYSHQIDPGSWYESIFLPEEPHPSLRGLQSGLELGNLSDD